jgi:HK97 family phage prohead protease
VKTREQAAQARAESGAKPAHRPSQRRAFADPEDGPRGYVVGGTMAAREAGAQERADGAASGPGVTGCASVVDTPYTMYDFFGPYTEIVSSTAFDITLAADPLVEFTLNHNKGGGAPMAHTRNGTLVLAMTEEGLTYDASVDGTRHDVGDMLKALERGDLAESSFKFSIDAGRWNDAFDTYTIMQVDLDRGDVSSVNFGANPYATSAARNLAEQVAEEVVRKLRDTSDELTRHRPDHRSPSDLGL